MWNHCSLTLMTHYLVLLLSLLPGITAWATSPGFSEEMKGGAPPSAQIFKHWMEVQHTAGQFAGGEVLAPDPVDAPVRIPFIVVTLGDTPQDLRTGREETLNQVRKVLFNAGGAQDESLQSYFNQLFRSKITFFDPSDLLEVTLSLKAEDYFTGDRGHPRRRFLDDLAAQLSKQYARLSLFDNEQVKQIQADPTKVETGPEIDLAVIIVLTDALDAHDRLVLWPLPSFARAARS